MSKCTESLFRTGLQNTVEKVIQCHFYSQKMRLSMTRTELKVLKRIKWRSPTDAKLNKRLATSRHDASLTECTLPTTTEGGAKQEPSRQEVVDTDAAAYRGRRAKAVVVTTKANLLVSVTVPDAREAEELAVSY